MLGDLTRRITGLKQQYDGSLAIRTRLDRDL
jgi:hypothetical protein